MLYSTRRLCHVCSGQQLRFQFLWFSICLIPAWFRSQPENWQKFIPRIWEFYRISLVLLCPGILSQLSSIPDYPGLLHLVSPARKMVGFSTRVLAIGWTAAPRAKLQKVKLTSCCSVSGTFR